MSKRLHAVQPDQQAADRRRSESFLQETVEFWQARSGRKLSREDARQITENLTGFFRVLEGWRKSNQAMVTGVDSDGKKRAA
jgi:hypothetical protein